MCLEGCRCLSNSAMIFTITGAPVPQMVCELLLERGDYILLEEYTYPSVIESVIVPKGYKPLGVQLDQDGILPESLLEVLQPAHAQHHTALRHSTAHT